ncbi:acyl-CoA thioester hydrolase [Cribrihabitans marinus]|uniref:Acyl-CoA thioester hydrolase n=1 Tax=Cribrihabitans marinus TaxID=1227549 RepID=A0A1H6SKF0_9RHOB|nr:thioesterase family protein [Cribrihabitans marinus]GGH23237.1 carnitine dehydrogenase [Cribrihabitans marinus]SEI68438.1 acyl-CoA thioester hydrolase [Cribrihabitans marinus]
MTRQIPHSGHDGPYPAPVEVAGQQALPEWIDYNGHMNVGYYGVAFDRALEVMLDDHLGLGETCVATAGCGPYVIQSHQHFLREVKAGEAFGYRFRLLDHDSKRLHYFAEMVAGADGATCATQEALIVNVSQATGRSAPFPDWALPRLERMAQDHRQLPDPPQRGAGLGIRRR